MCIDDVKDIIAEYKIYDYKGDRQAWNEYGELLDKIESDKRYIDIVDFKSEEEYWENEMEEWEDIL